MHVSVSLNNINTLGIAYTRHKSLNITSKLPAISTKPKNVHITFPFKPKSNISGLRTNRIKFPKVDSIFIKPKKGISINTTPYATPFPKYQYQYVYDYSKEDWQDSRYARLELLDNYYWILYDGNKWHEKIERYMRYAQPLSKRHRINYKKGVTIVIPDIDKVTLTDLLKGTYQSVYDVPYTYQEKPVIIGVADAFTEQEYSMSWSKDDLGGDKFLFIDQITLHHTYEPEVKVRRISLENIVDRYRGDDVDENGNPTPVYDAVIIETEPKKFYDNYIVYYNCKPHRLICPKIIIEAGGVMLSKSYKYFLRLKHSQKCVSIKKDYVRPLKKIRHFTIFLGKPFKFDHVDIYTKEEYSFRCFHPCNKQYQANYEFYFRLGNSFHVNYADKSHLYLTQVYVTSNYSATLGITCVFNPDNEVPKAYLPLFMPAYEPKSHRAKVICMRWS